MVFASVLFPLGLAFLGMQGLAPTLAGMVGWPVMLVAIGFCLSGLSRFGPSRPNAGRRRLSVRSIIAGLVWILVLIGLAAYCCEFADNNAAYGSLGAVVGLTISMWLSAIVVLFGAVPNAEIEHETARDTTTK